MISYEEKKRKMLTLFPVDMRRRKYMFKIGDRVRFREGSVHMILTISSIDWEDGSAGAVTVTDGSFISRCSVEAVRFA